ncbi:MAG: mevalonate kinase [Deltaproteobacteria bacterium]|nr:mevalonate kinase [Deltaproteobacteria bacterium]
MSGSGFGRGKVILLGEHAVVHGEPALAGALARGVRAEAAAGAAHLRVAAWGLEARPDGAAPVDRAFAAILAATGAGEAAVTADAEIPVGAGLGSSAALAAAVARALCSDEARVADAVAASERIFHGNPSGIDAAMALGGGFGRFTRGGGLERFAAAPVRLCVANTGRRRDTGALVAGVSARLRDRPAATAALLRAIGALVDQGVTALREGRLTSLGEVMDRNQAALAEVGVSCSEIETACELARRAGALGAKLTGAGGGGCVVALAPGREEAVLAAWRAAGLEAFAAEVGFQHGSQ